MKILYVHGYNGSPEGHSCNLLRSFLPEGWTIEGIDYDQNDCAVAIKQIRNYISEHGINLVIGSSLGGFITLQLGGVSRMIINPCLKPSLELPKLGASEALANTYKPYEDIYLDLEERMLVTAFFADNDELFGEKYLHEFERPGRNIFRIHSGHHISEDGAKTVISCIQEHTERMKQLNRFIKAQDDFLSMVLGANDTVKELSDFCAQDRVIWKSREYASKHNIVSDGEFYYQLDDSHMTAKVIGRWWDAKSKMVIPGTIVFDAGKYTVTEIAESAFDRQRGQKSLSILTNITLPQTLRHIGKNAFRGLEYDLEDFEIPDGCDIDW